MQMLSTFTKEYPFNWEWPPPQLHMTYNMSKQATTDFSPFIVMFGREAQLPSHVMYGSNQPETNLPQYNMSRD